MWHDPKLQCSCNGNFLVNIGITADGRIIPIFEERLRQMGMLTSIALYQHFYGVYYILFM